MERDNERGRGTDLRELNSLGFIEKTAWNVGRPYESMRIYS